MVVYAVCGYRGIYRVGILLTKLSDTSRSDRLREVDRMKPRNTGPRQNIENSPISRLFKDMTEAFRFEDQVEAQGIAHTVCGPKILVEYQPLDAEDDTLHLPQIAFKWLPPDGQRLEDSIGHLSSFDVQSSTHSMTMADFMNMPEDMFHSLNGKVACYANWELVDEARRTRQPKTREYEMAKCDAIHIQASGCPLGPNRNHLNKYGVHGQRITRTNSVGGHIRNPKAQLRAHTQDKGEISGNWQICVVKSRNCGQLFQAISSHITESLGAVKHLPALWTEPGMFVANHNYRPNHRLFDLSDVTHDGELIFRTFETCQIEARTPSSDFEDNASLEGNVEIP
ncbi:hypothetical protein PCH_Pc06g00450 [Penicillium rubens Wisconsin 54-1255]|uniref:Uncharacterized protein n=1 Tax=Penicillium rubens (strain ATCC 28089 / DSM 1075 / NRRL 1951 / Wisconsin 54-1255) TaxID=500485 RepID=B6GVZ0_PENRW|nr:hypothetical protein PCH_Pc06g00450 [Penicillium rubens Wisconsin 54-1255]